MEFKDIYRKKVILNETEQNTINETMEIIFNICKKASPYESCTKKCPMHCTEGHCLLDTLRKIKNNRLHIEVDY